MNALFFIDLGGQIFFRFLLDEFILMMSELHQIGYLHNFEMEYPANAAIFQTFLIHFIEFKLLEPEEIIHMWDPEFDLQEELGLEKDAIDSLKAFSI